MLNLKQHILVLLVLMFIGTTVNANIKNVPIPASNTEPILLNKAKLIGHIDPNVQINFTVWLKFRNREQLNRVIDEIYNPRSQNYQKFLTKEQFDTQYAPTTNIENTVQQYFIAQGMQTEVVNHSVRVVGTAQQVEKVLQIQINNYQYKNKTFYSNATPPHMNSELAQYVSGITGLSNIPRFRPLAVPTETSLNGFTGANLKHTFNLASIPSVKNTAINGAGQTMVIVDACGSNAPATIMSDANIYNSNNGISLLSASNFAAFNGTGSPYTGPCTNPEAADWSGEIALDVESSHTIAPGANIALVLAANGDVGTALADIISYLHTHNYTVGGFSNAVVVSNSWGGLEDSNDPLESYLQEAAAGGMSVNFATGDCGDQTYNSSACSKASTSPSVGYPASSTYVTAVGGTSLFVDANWNYAFETGWGTYVNGASYFGSTGGISKYYGPASWQSSISGFTAGGYPAGIVGHYNKRAVPDIAMLGDPVTGLIIYFTGDCPTGCEIGGTSLASPLFTATLALVNQTRFLTAGKAQPIGQAAPYLYTFHSNLVSSKALNVIIPPHQIIPGATKAPASGPLSAFTISGITFSWDSSLTIIENQFWNDVTGVGSANIPNFVPTMASL